MHGHLTVNEQTAALLLPNGRAEADEECNNNLFSPLTLHAMQGLMDHRWDRVVPISSAHHPHVLSPFVPAPTPAKIEPKRPAATPLPTPSSGSSFQSQPAPAREDEHGYTALDRFVSPPKPPLIGFLLHARMAPRPASPTLHIPPPTCPTLPLCKLRPHHPAINAKPRVRLPFPLSIPSLGLPLPSPRQRSSRKRLSLLRPTLYPPPLPSPPRSDHRGRRGQGILDSSHPRPTRKRHIPATHTWNTRGHSSTDPGGSTPLTRSLSPPSCAESTSGRGQRCRPRQGAGLCFCTVS